MRTNQPDSPAREGMFRFVCAPSEYIITGDNTPLSLPLEKLHSMYLPVVERMGCNTHKYTPRKNLRDIFEYIYVTFFFNYSLNNTRWRRLYVIQIATKGESFVIIRLISISQPVDYISTTILNNDRPDGNTCTDISSLDPIIPYSDEYSSSSYIYPTSENCLPRESRNATMDETDTKPGYMSLFVYAACR